MYYIAQMRYSKRKKQELATAILKEYGETELALSAACRAVGVPHNTFINWLDSDPDLNDRFEAVNDDRRERRRRDWATAAAIGIKERLTGYTIQLPEVTEDGEGNILTRRTRTQHVPADSRLAADVLSRFDPDFRTAAEAAAEAAIPIINVHHRPETAAPPNIVFQLADGTHFDNPQPTDNE